MRASEKSLAPGNKPVSAKPVVLRAVAAPLRSITRRSQQLCRRLNAGVTAAGRSSLHILRTAWAEPPPLPAAARRAAGLCRASSSGNDQQLTLDLDWKADLTLPQEVICWHTAGAICCVVYALTAPAALSIPYATLIGLLFGLVLSFMRSSMMEVLYKVCAAPVVLLPPLLLRVVFSLEGMHTHKACTNPLPPNSTPTPGQGAL